MTEGLNFIILDTLLLKSILHSSFLSCLPPVNFLLQDLIAKYDDITFSHFVTLSFWLWQFLILSLFSVTHNFEEYQSDTLWDIPQLGFVWFFPQLDGGYGCLRRRPSSWQEHMVHTKIQTINMIYHHWCCLWSPGQDSVGQISPLLHPFALLPSLSIPYPGRKSVWPAHTKEWRVMF